MESADGQPFEGFQWRITTSLKINYIWLEHHVDTDPGCEGWFDDLVIATKYIGPINTSDVRPLSPSGLKLQSQ